MSQTKTLTRTLGKKINLTFCGLDFAGKTAMLYRLMTGKFIENLTPTTSVNIEKVVLEGGLLNITIFDLGGQSKLRDSWDEYIRKADAIIFVVDANDPQRFIEAKKEFNDRVIEKLTNKLCIISANKLDLVYEKSNDTKLTELIFETENLIREKLEIPNKPQFVIYATSQKNGLGMSKIIRCLRNKLSTS